MVSVLTALAILSQVTTELEDTISGSLQEQLSALLKRYDGSLRDYLRDPEKAKAACRPFLKLARENPGDPAAVEALHWVVTHTFLEDEAGQAMGLLMKDHIKSGRIGPICRELERQYGKGFKPLEDLFRTAIRDNPSREIQGATCLALARRLTRDKENIECARLLHEAGSRGINLPFVAEPTETKEDLDRIGEEASRLFQRVIEQYGDIKDGSDTLGDSAKCERALVVGQLAPEIIGQDVDGQQFKLSDFRGKIVVLTFWNHEGCAICRASYPAEREMVKRMEGKPVVHLGVNNGDRLETLKGLRESREVTWRFWVDGDVMEGKNFRTWAVRGWPTVFVIDSKGVLRHKGFWMMQIPLIEYAVEKLLGEQKP